VHPSHLKCQNTENRFISLHYEEKHEGLGKQNTSDRYRLRPCSNEACFPQGEFVRAKPTFSFAGIVYHISKSDTAKEKSLRNTRFPYYVFVALCIVVIVVSLIKIAASNENIECFREYFAVGYRATDPSFL
jgi:hypothetical protein